MGMTLILVVTLFCQAIAAILAIRLIWFTGRRWVMWLIAGAIVLLVVRRLVPASWLLFRGDGTGGDLVFQLAELLISVLILSGIAGMFPAFRSLRESERSTRESQRRLKHLNAVLRGVSEVGQLIAQEKDRGRLLDGVCSRLTESGAYRHVWIVIRQDGQFPVMVADSGMDATFAELREKLQSGEEPVCMRQVLASTGLRILSAASSACSGCDVCRLHSDGRTMALRLGIGGEVYGMMVASLADETAIDSEDDSLLREVAEDVSFALRSLQLEYERLRSEKLLRLDESRLETLLQLNQMSEASFQEITDFALEEAVRLTESTIGYLAFLNADESELTMHAWSKTAMGQCEIIDKPIVYQVVETGLWGEAVRQRKPVITNDYAAPNPAKKGYPSGHVHVHRHMNIPIFDGSRIVIVAGVGNKEEAYGEADIRQLTLLMQGMWQLIQRRRGDQELRQAHDELECRVRDRTSALGAANEELKHERYLLHALMDNLPHSIYFKDGESRFLRINKALCKYFGLSDPSQALGKSDRDFFASRHAAEARTDEEEILRTGQPIIEKEEEEFWSDGHVTWVSTTKMPLYDDAGDIVGTFGISRDITERKQAQEALRISETKYRTLYDASRDAIMILAPGGRFVSGNPAAIAVYGCRDEQEFISLTPVDLSPDYQPDGVLSSVKALQMVEKALQEGCHFFEWVHRRRDGREFFASVLLTRMEIGGNVVVQATVRDISDEKRSAAALRAAKDAAEAANRAKSTFLANMSHEIRTPLNAIIGMTELVLDTKLSAQQREFLSTVRDSGEALLAVINDILDFSRIEAGKLVLDQVPFELREVVGDTVKSLALRAHKQRIELACHVGPEVPAFVVGDPARVRQLLVNLVGNALKFTEQGEIVVDVRARSRDDGHAILHFSVRDTGIGIPEEKQASVFQAFEQVDGSLTRRHGGSGLGLAISTRLVEQMGGRMWLESRVGQGSVFHFEARFGVAEGESEESRRIDLSSLHDLKVLVVDDNDTNRLILQEMLASWGMLPAVASRAREGLHMMQEAVGDRKPFRLVLSDTHMPEMDGFMLAEQIGQDSKIDQTAIILLTSGDRPEDMERCEQSGIAAYLLKPVKQSELFDAIVEALEITHEGDTAEALMSHHPKLTTPRRILLAEDSVVNQKLAVALLERFGHKVTVANNGLEAIEAAASAAFDVVLMDIQMPVMDGLEATAKIRAREKAVGGHIPIVAMTAHALKGDRELCLAAGMDDYVSKPIRREELFEKLARLVPDLSSASSEQSPKDETPDSDGVVDWTQIRDLTGGDSELVKSLIADGLEEAARLLGEIGDSIARGDRERLRTAAHTLKGSVRYFGAEQLCQLIARLESLAVEGPPDEIAEVQRSFEKELDIVTSVLKRRLQAMS